MSTLQRVERAHASRASSVASTERRPCPNSAPCVGCRQGRGSHVAAAMNATVIFCLSLALAVALTLQILASAHTRAPCLACRVVPLALHATLTHTCRATTPGLRAVQQLVAPPHWRVLLVAIATLWCWAVTSPAPLLLSRRRRVCHRAHAVLVPWRRQLGRRGQLRAAGGVVGRALAGEWPASRPPGALFAS